ncbi:MAG: manganese efflux pump MntP family protein [Chloroflexota bacterium]
MNFISVLGIALALCADCFAVALSSAVSLVNHTFLRVFRTAFTFGTVQALMLVAGWLAGRTVMDLISAYDHWLAFGLLLFVGGRMLWESRRTRQEGFGPDFTKGWLLITLAFVTSFDALAVGLSFAFLEVNIVMAGATVGVVTFLVVTSGALLGRKVSGLIGKRAETVGGIILILIGLRILLTDLR